MPDIDYFTIVERLHTFQNPTSEEKLDRLIRYLNLADGTRVLDVGCGKAWLLRRMSQSHRIEGVGIEIRRSFLDEADKAHRQAPGLGKIALLHLPAAEYSAPAGTFDIALCIGASFAIGSFEDMVRWLKPLIKAGGYLAIADIYTRTDTLAPEAVQYFSGGAVRTLIDTVDWLEAAGLSLVGLIESSTDEWDAYENLHWQCSDAWLRENRGHPEWASFRTRSEADKREYLTAHRDALGWAIFVCRVS
jgi:cyclopropane fatty-acyl-phospholipid synthase-like methyltransferase